MTPSSVIPDFKTLLAEVAHELWETGTVDEACLLKRVRQIEPEATHARVVAARCLELVGLESRALQLYEQGIRMNPGQAFGHTRRAEILLNPYFPRVSRQVVAPSPPYRGRIQINSLGNNGRFGNQLVQYGTLKTLSLRFGLELEVPYWVGRHLFGLDDPYPDETPLPPLSEEHEDFPTLFSKHPRIDCTDRNIQGYLQRHIRDLAPYRESFRNWFTPIPQLQSILDRREAEFRKRGNTLVALHLRRGDFGYGQFWIAPESWYLSWLESVWETFDKPVLYIATDDASTLEAFHQYRPLSSRNHPVKLPGAEFYPDFYVLSRADIVATSNSSFSITAAMLNTRGTGFLRPDREKATLSAFRPWETELFH